VIPRWTFIVACVVLLACSREKTTPTVASRVVSLSPSTTEALFAMGADHQVVGRSRFDDFPPQVLRLPQVGGYVDPSYEAILALKPDLVTGARGPTGPDIATRLESRGIATYFPETESFAAIDAMILGLGARLGLAAEAKSVVARVDARVSEVERAVAGKPRPRVLFVFGLAPIVVAGPKSFPGEMLRHAGAENAVDQGEAYPTIGVERVLALDPDVVVNAAIAEAHGAERITPTTPGWAELRAVKEGRVRALTDESVLRPGPRIGDGLATLAHAVHPDANLR
jgi:iron complex transport system substrate-binding protein